MSDNESYEYEYNDDSDEEMQEAQPTYSDEEQSDFIYTDEDEEASEVDADIENAYYNAKGLKDSIFSSDNNIQAKEEDITNAVSAFEQVIQMEKDETVGIWSFKAMKQLVKLYIRLGLSVYYDKMIIAYKNLLQCIATCNITQNSIEKGINSILERVGNEDLLIKEFYDVTLETFDPNNGSCPNERLWFKTNLKLGQLLYEMNHTNELQHVIKDLLRGSSCDGRQYVGTHLMEIYALQIQLYSRIKDTKKLRSIFEKAMAVEGSIPHPRTLALIQELGGKMHMASREFRQAGKTFFQAFKSYDEAGDPSRLRCLKYLVMASMLHAEGINPFDSQEARPYKDDPQIVVMTNLVQAFHGNEIRKFESILRRNEGNIMDDDFVRENLADLLRTIRTQVLINLIAPYTRISLQYIANELNNIPIEDVESLLISLILDGKLDGKIDQVQGILVKNVSYIPSNNSNKTTDAVQQNNVVSAGDDFCARNCDAVGQLSTSLESLNIAITNVGRRSVYHQIL